jgi:hypothetical protein
MQARFIIETALGIFESVTPVSSSFMKVTYLDGTVVCDSSLQFLGGTGNELFGFRIVISSLEEFSYYNNLSGKKVLGSQLLESVPTGLVEVIKVTGHVAYDSSDGSAFNLDFNYTPSVDS